MKKSFYPLIIIFIVSSCAKVDNLYMSNPAANKCVNDKGKIITLKSAVGESGICVFNDGSVCEEWKYFRKECNPGDCKLTCRDDHADGKGLYDCNNRLIILENCIVNKK